MTFVPWTWEVLVLCFHFYYMFYSMDLIAWDTVLIFVFLGCLFPPIFFLFFFFQIRRVDNWNCTEAE